MALARVTVHGVDLVKRRLKNQSRMTVRDLGSALFIEGEKIMAKSKHIVPVATGNLRASGHVQKPQVQLGIVFVELGYGGAAAPYALSVHENPRAGKTEGVSPQGVPYPRTKAGKPTWSHHPQGQYKYLEKPFREAVPGMRERIRGFISARLRLGAG